MLLVFSDDVFPSSVTASLFLAGPSPRSTDELDWRHEALRVLEEKGFKGTIFIPVPRRRFLEGSTDRGSWNYDNQIAWECEARARADLIVFWLAREIDRSKEDLGMPGFTTNFELGEDLRSGKLVYGRPSFAPKCRYMDKRVQELGLPVHDSMVALMDDAVASLGEGAHRSDGEAYVPLFIWRSEQFRTWYGSLKEAGNRLESARLGHHVRFGGKTLFSYVLWVNIWIKAEQRFKTNEFIFSRPDISSVVAYHRRESTGDLLFALVREFRSSVNNSQGFVYEAPGGSSKKAGVDPQVNAGHEMYEEVGLDIEDISRFRFVGNRQVIATLSTHRANVYAIELTEAEFAKLEQAARLQEAFGVAEDTERTYVHLVSMARLFELPVDYSTLGMLFETICSHTNV
jgi:hypothetical protein